MNIPDIVFTAAGYKKNYEAHLKTLEAFAEHTKDAGIMPKLQARLLRNARYILSLLAYYKNFTDMALSYSRHAKVSPDATVAPIALLSIDDFAAASKEWEERDEHDDDE